MASIGPGSAGLWPAWLGMSGLTLQTSLEDCAWRPMEPQSLRMFVNSFEYHLVTSEEAERLASDFCDAHGDQKYGTIADEEYDKLFDHLAQTLAHYGTFRQGTGEEADFSGYRYVDQIPWITIVPSDEVPPSLAVKAALAAVETSHRPLAVSFDFHSGVLLILPGRKVFTSFSEREVRGQN